MSYEECEYLSNLTRPRAVKRLRTENAISAACWGVSVLLAFLMGMAM